MILSLQIIGFIDGVLLAILLIRLIRGIEITNTHIDEEQS